MNLVADASILVEAFRPEQSGVRAWLDDLLGRDRLYVVAGHTFLEVSSALRSLVNTVEASADWAGEVHRRLIDFPLRLMPVGQPTLIRVWELRHNHTPYDAVYMTLTEQLQADHGHCALVTADRRLADSPVVACPVRLYPRDAEQ